MEGRDNNNNHRVGGVNGGGSSNNKGSPFKKKVDLSSFYKKQLLELDIKNFPVNNYLDVNFELLLVLHIVQSRTCEAIFRGEIKDDTDDASRCNPNPRGNLEILNTAAWSHYLMSKDGKRKLILNDIDCILIFIRQGQIKNDPSISPILHLQDADVNVINMTAKRHKENGMLSDEDAVLVRSPYNDRKRMPNTSRMSGQQFNINEAIKQGFLNIGGEFGLKWCIQKNNKKNPSLTQIMLGLKLFFMERLSQKLKNRSKEKAALVIKEYDRIFEQILWIAGFGLDSIDKPLAHNYENLPNGGAKIIKEGLYDPDNKITQLILWLYTIEPSFCQELNGACVAMNLDYIDIFGPFAFAMSLIVAGAEFLRPDKLPRGADNHYPSKKLMHPLGFFNCSFLIFRGAALKKEWIEDWKQSVGVVGLKDRTTGYVDQLKPGYVRLQGNINAYESFKIALSYGMSDDNDLITCLFVISLQNYRSYNGFRCNKEAYSAHHYEREVVLMDAISMFVMSVQEIYLNNTKMIPATTVNAAHQSKKDALGDEPDVLHRLSGKTIIVIHLCNLD